ncbi:dna polymerase iii subunit beta : DNA polymerase III, beta chain OS=Rhodopirellula baltica SWK14 GN=RBSWK_02256 PE=4 SV=1: DNA_pol3_beta: DNA_pol3_beta_2: DNA_pol3_beta_3 [Gemmataceae bacterium]|nr:dna polymerase iii subunit beta : DNA polymerase III, beta chain OS=Rhodopirellula baltica SWK14 GN=RBSWK_02256 PE=4 SV=1: DNA_pol3_beta: DNA_pol3_beta_2: DNA_pol3_beta_3 [Gemmataceae bacterium]VTU00591.1 dna polymerase iii subunit beta : DNA polymerase III, beta chain OS=Rhodopirellula baltica SWK14 GN=RBSWK_02256 PE=4 SV=1: DNA_pol3_beta: DNA_pol3_beta_2: DNA_pol3_beta_3 [Gemmataceae bacterium]
MKLTCPRNGLLTACQLVSAAVPARTTKEILSSIKAVAQDDALTLIAFDTEVGIRYELRGNNVSRPGAAILPINQLTDILKNCPDDEISLDTGPEVTKVKAGTSRYELPTRPVDEFPDLPAFDDAGRYHEVTAGILRAMIRRTAFAADKKDSGGRFALKGVLWEAEGRTARLVATDTKRLALCEGPASVYGPADAVKATHLVPPKAIALLERNLTDDGELVRVGLRTNDAVFQTERAMIYTTLVQGRYPPYKDIIGQTRKGAAVQIPLPVDGFLARVRQAAIVTDDESKRVDMRFSAGKVAMQARGADTGSSEVELPLPDYDGPEVSIAFDPSYLVEFLRAMEGEPTVMLEMTDGTKPALFKCGDSYVYLVMPLAG